MRPTCRRPDNTRFTDLCGTVRFSDSETSIGSKALPTKAEDQPDARSLSKQRRVFAGSIIVVNRSPFLGQPDRCVHVGDRESDIYELYCLVSDVGTRFVVRTVVDWLEAGDYTVKSEMRGDPSADAHNLNARSPNISLPPYFKLLGERCARIRRGPC
jgi:hypothetical protein